MACAGPSSLASCAERSFIAPALKRPAAQADCLQPDEVWLTSRSKEESCSGHNNLTQVASTACERDQVPTFATDPEAGKLPDCQPVSPGEVCWKASETLKTAVYVIVAEAFCNRFALGDTRPEPAAESCWPVAVRSHS